MDPQSIFYLACGVALFATGSWLIHVQPMLGYAIIGFFCATAWSIPLWNPIVSALGVAFTLPDFVSAIFIAGATLQLLSRRLVLRGVLRWAPLLFAVIMGISLVRGLFSIGLAAASNEARPWLLIIAISVWTLADLCSRPGAEAAFRAWLFSTSSVVVIVGILNVVQYGFGGASTARRSLSGEILEAGRPITSGQAMMIAIASLYIIYCWQETRRPMYGWVAAVGGVCVLLAQHRSVWLAFLAGLAVIVVAASGAIRRKILVSALVCFTILAIASNSRLLGRLGSLLTSSAADTRTYDGRLYDWQVLIERSVTQGLDAVMFGAPMGSGWDRFRADGAEIRYIPHNWYVATYLRVGVVGLCLMILVIATIAVRAAKMSAADPTAAVVAAIIVYCWSYNLQWYLAPVIGWAIYKCSRQIDLDMQEEPKHSRETYSGVTSAGEAST